MRIGIIAEGWSDIAVITNLIKGVTGLDTNDIVPIQPRLQYDNTHLAHLNPDTHSSWTSVRKECMEQRKMDAFFQLEDSQFFVIHIDAAEAPLYEVVKPAVKDHTYCGLLRTAISDKMREWLRGNYTNVAIFAIAIEEIDAWVLTLYDIGKTCFIVDSKKALKKTLNKLDFKYEAGKKSYLAYSDDFKNPNKLRRTKCLENNCSLNLFYQELVSKLKPAE